MNVKQLNVYLNEGMNATIKKKMAEEEIDSIAESMENKLEIPKADAKKLIAKAYKKIYEADKYEQERVKIEELYDNLDAASL